MSEKPKQTAMDIFAENILKTLEESEETKSLSWNKPYRTLDTRYRNAFSNHTYSGLHNVLTCALSGFSDPRYMTFNQVRKAGGQVKKGSKATYLIAWNFTKKKVQKENGEEEEKTIPFAKKVVLFNAEQVDGLDLPEINNDILDESMVEDDRILRILKELEVNYESKVSNAAYYNPKEDKITIPDVKQVESLDKWNCTVLHELIRWTADRVERDCSKYNFDVEERALEELVAELGSMFLCMKLNMNSYADENSMAYLKSWISAAKGKNGKNFVYRACKLAEKACNYIIENTFLNENKEEDIQTDAA
jgi:antirestriction protein ArdC